MSNIHLRGLDNHLIKLLKKEALRQDTSVNSLILILLKRSLGLTKERILNVHHDMDAYAGTWKKQQADSFLKSITDFEQIEKDLWE